MATTAIRALTSDPLRSFKFNVVIPNFVPGGPTTGEARFGFMSMSGLGVSIEPLTYREGGDNLTTRKMPGQADFNPITLSRGLFSTDNDNWIWMQQLFTAMYGTATGMLVPNSPDFRNVIYINILEHPNTTSQAPGTPYGATFPAQDSIVKWSAKLYTAWIGSLAYSDLDAGGNTVAVEQMTINYEGFDTMWGQAGYVANPTSW
jgi:phage tail-like protein